MGYEVQEGVAAQRSHGQRHQEAEEELEEDPVHERDEDDAEQGEHADDGDGDEAADPGCNKPKPWRFSPYSLIHPAKRAYQTKLKRSGGTKGWSYVY